MIQTYFEEHIRSAMQGPTALSKRYFIFREKFQNMTLVYCKVLTICSSTHDGRLCQGFCVHLANFAGLMLQYGRSANTQQQAIIT
jgi:repressor of nif and glnA expression